MCGIIGYTGSENVKDVLLDALELLEYRGYDSAGIAVKDETSHVTNVYKCAGRVSDLRAICDSKKILSACGIGHTRWATHGGVTDQNAHPHQQGKVTLVHNGIIENYRELIADYDLQEILHSETDSEVVVHMMDYYYKKEKDLQKALERVITRIEGSYALCIVSTIEPDKVFIAKKDSPLVIGKTADASVAASDIPAILDYTKDVYFLEDYEIAILNKGNVSFFDQYGNPIEKEITTIPYDNEAAQKGGYDTFMLKEIHEQPYAIAETLRGRVEGTDRIVLPELDAIHDKFKTFNKAYFVACGTAYHACLSGANILERLTGIPTFTQVASEFRYCDPIVDEKTMCVFVSQSGETADTMAALRLAKEKGCTTIAVANVLGSSISREADHTIYTCAGPEIAVASTKAYTTQLIVLLLLGMYISQALGNENEDYKRIIEGIASLPQHIENILKDEKTFEHYASYLKDLKDENNVDWFKNSIKATKANRQYCIDNKDKFKTYNENSWGLTACLSPKGYISCGAKPCGVDLNIENDGTVTPCGAIGSIVFTPKESISAMEYYYNNYPNLWGKYGFKDGYNLEDVKPWFAKEYIGIDKGIEAIMIENYLNGTIWNYFMRNDYVQKGLKVLGFSKNSKKSEIKM